MKFSLFFFPGSVDAPCRSYAALLKVATYADLHGFHAIWIPERHFHGFGGLFPNPVVGAAWLASATKHIGLRAGSVLLPLHNPVRVAEDWAMVDNLSGGRVGIAVGSGWHADDFVLNATGFEERREIAQRSLETLRRLWRGEPVEMTGGMGETKPIVTFPRPMQSELPLWITCTGTPGTFLTAASGGFGVLTYTVSQSLDDLGTALSTYRSAFRPNVSRDAPKVTVMAHTYVGRDQADVEAHALEPYYRYLKASVSLFKNQMQAGAVAADTLHPADVDSLVRHSGERLRRSRSLVGTESECSAVLDALRRIGVDEVACLVDFGVDLAAMMA
ncbi:MAG: MupA/Atu3671 family FMN-dependent luciferase-like monooxygenase, partial [Vicinamibacterales bacterium]